MKKNEYGETISLIYSAGIWNSYSQEIAEPLLKKVGEYNSRVIDCLDLACGQGVLVEKMINNGINAIGIDLSLNMLRKNNRLFGTHIFVGDMRTIYFDMKFDLITCVFNSINHLLNDEELEQTFGNVKQLLRKNGIFFFDILNSSIKPYDKHDIVSINNNVYSEKILVDNQVVNTFIFKDNKDQSAELIRQYLFSEEAIYKCSNKVGLRIIWKGRCLPDFSNKFQHRTFFVVKRK